jgi:hypothetical protein
MAEPEFTAKQVRDLLWTKIDPRNRTGRHDQLSLAAAIGVSASFLNDVMHERREPTGKILEYLGLERVVVYRIPKRSSSGKGAQP